MFVYLLLRYLMARRGLGQVVPFVDHAGHVIRVGYQLFRWPKRVRVINPQHCPKNGPAIFVGNHYKLDDPIYLWPAIYECSNKTILVSFMMRDDFFHKFPFKWWLFDLNEVAGQCKALTISRDRLSISQLKPFLELLAKSDAFLMFPGRSRSRSGLCLEYRDDIEDSASVAFFVSQAQRRNPAMPVPVIPMGRTWHAVENTSAVVFGAPLYLPVNANRQEQRALDLEMLTRMAELIEINALHLVGGLCWLRCLHRRPLALPLSEMQEAVVAVTKALTGRYVEPALRATPHEETRKALAFFTQGGCVVIDKAGNIHLNAERILHAPELTPAYRNENPVKYHANQIAHFSDVVAMLEATTLLDPPGRDAQLARITDARRRQLVEKERETDESVARKPAATR